MEIKPNQKENLGPPGHPAFQILDQYMKKGCPNCGKIPGYGGYIKSPAEKLDEITATSEVCCNHCDPEKKREE